MHPAETPQRIGVDEAMRIILEHLPCWPAVQVPIEHTLGAVLRQQQAVQAEMTKALEAPLAPLAELTRQNMEMWARVQASMLSAMNPSAGGGAGTGTAPSADEPPPAGEQPHTGRKPAGS